MERIKQALDKARTEREAAGTGASAVKIAESAKVPATAVETAIQYSQTKVAAADSNVLRDHRVIFGETDRVGLTAYKMLRTQVLQRMTARNWNALGITSPAPEDGKTLTAINLAISLARELHHTVLLVDADLRNPSVLKYFGLKVAVGIGDYLLKGVPMGEVLINPGIDRLVILPGREPVANSSEILASPAMGELVQELKNRYPARMVLFDLPPILSADDALSFTPYADAFLMVLRNGKTNRDELEHAMDIMKDATILGTVLNASDEKISAYY